VDLFFFLFFWARINGQTLTSKLSCSLFRSSRTGTLEFNSTAFLIAIVAPGAQFGTG